MKAVLISIKPNWCKLIWSGMKTVEIRKSRPKLETPFKVYIYCTLAGSDSLFMDVLNRDVAAWNRGGWPEKKDVSLESSFATTSDALALNTVSSKKISSLQFLEAVSQYRKSKTMPDGSPG